MTALKLGSAALPLGFPDVGRRVCELKFTGQVYVSGLRIEEGEKSRACTQTHTQESSTCLPPKAPGKFASFADDVL